MRPCRPSRPPAPSPLPLLLALLPLVVITVPAAGQVVPTRVSPVVRADLLEILPSRGMGMGGISIAIRDTVGDAWSNPAAAARLTGTRVFGAPVAYDVTRGAGEGAAVVAGAMSRRGPWFAAGAFALQDVEPGQAIPRFPGPLRLEAGASAVDLLGTEPSGTGAHGFALLGRAFGGVSVGGSVVAERRHAVDGIGLLYGDSDGLEAAGHVATFRVGVLAESADGSSLEAVAVHARTRMTHDVVYADFTWDPETQILAMSPREERNAEASNVWGLRLSHQRPLGGGWRLGWLATGNIADYPRLPLYDAPRDGITDLAGARAEAQAYELGVGVVREAGTIVLGADVVYEPIRSRIEGTDGAATTVVNRIRWHNAVVRGGIGRAWQPRGAEHTLDARVGFSARRLDYRLAQFDHRQQAGRDEHRSWLEWSPTWGGGIGIGAFALRYTGSVLRGTERPVPPTQSFGRCFDVCVLDVVGPWPFPSPSLEPREVSVLTHRLFLSYALGGAR